MTPKRRQLHAPPRRGLHTRRRRASNDTARRSWTHARLEERTPSKSRLDGVESSSYTETPRRRIKSRHHHPTPTQIRVDPGQESLIEAPRAPQTPAKARSKKWKIRPRSSHRKSRPHHILTTLASSPLRKSTSTEQNRRRRPVLKLWWRNSSLEFWHVEKGAEKLERQRENERLGRSSLEFLVLLCRSKTNEDKKLMLFN